MTTGEPVQDGPTGHRDNMLLKEYELCQKSAHEFESNIWQTAGLMTGGSIAGLVGLLVTALDPQKPSFLILFIGGGLLVLVVWIWWFLELRWRSLQQVRFLRMRHIEEDLNLYQVRYSDYADWLYDKRLADALRCLRNSRLPLDRCKDLIRRAFSHRELYRIARDNNFPLPEKPRDTDWEQLVTDLIQAPPDCSEYRVPFCEIKSIFTGPPNHYSKGFQPSLVLLPKALTFLWAGYSLFSLSQALWRCVSPWAHELSFLWPFSLFWLHPAFTVLVLLAQLLFLSVCVGLLASLLIKDR